MTRIRRRPRRSTRCTTGPKRTAAAASRRDSLVLLVLLLLLRYLLVLRVPIPTMCSTTTRPKLCSRRSLESRLLCRTAAQTRRLIATARRALRTSSRLRLRTRRASLPQPLPERSPASATTLRFARGHVAASSPLLPAPTRRPVT